MCALVDMNRLKHRFYWQKNVWGSQGFNLHRPLCNRPQPLCPAHSLQSHPLHCVTDPASLSPVLMWVHHWVLVHLVLQIQKTEGERKPKPFPGTRIIIHCPSQPNQELVCVTICSTPLSHVLTFSLPSDQLMSPKSRSLEAGKPNKVTSYNLTTQGVRVCSIFLTLASWTVLGERLCHVLEEHDLILSQGKFNFPLKSQTFFWPRNTVTLDAFLMTDGSYEHRKVGDLSVLQGFWIKRARVDSLPVVAAKTESGTGITGDSLHLFKSGPQII